MSLYPAGNYTMTPNEIDDLPVSGHARALCKLLLRYKRQDAVCWPSQATLAHDIGVSVRTVYSALQELINIGLVSKVRRGLTRTNLYFLDHGVALVRKLRIILGLSTSDQERQPLPTTTTQGRYTPSSVLVRGYEQAVNLTDDARAALVARLRGPQRRE